MNRRGLGRGLDALRKVGTNGPSLEASTEIPVDQIEGQSRQPRKDFARARSTSWRARCARRACSARRGAPHRGQSLAADRRRAAVAGGPPGRARADPRRRP